MANENELLIKINADAKNLEKAFDDTVSKTADLEKQLDNIAKISGIAFAAVVAEIGFSAKAFAEAEVATNELTQALQTQGIFSKQLMTDYNELAKAVQEKTRFDDDAVTASQAVLQGYLGETKITKELTFAVADLAAKKGIDLNSAAILVGKTLGTSTNALAREGLQLSETASEAEKYTKVLEFIAGRAGGAAEAQAKGLEGAMVQLQNAFANAQEEIGGKFAPVLEKLARGLTKVITFASENEEIVNFGVALLTAGGIVSGVTLGLALAAKGFLLFKAAMAAAGVQANATKLAVQGLTAATGLGILLVVITELALHWETVWPRMRQVFAAFAENISSLIGNLGTIFKGLFEFDPAQIRQGLTDLKGTLQKGFADATKDLKPVQLPGTKAGETEGDDGQDAKLKAAAQKRFAAEREANERTRQLRVGENQLTQLELQNASAQTLALKKQEVDLLKRLESEKNADAIALLKERLEQVRQLEADQFAQDQERDLEFAQIKADTKAELAQQNIDADAQLRQNELAALEANLLTQAEVERKIQSDTLKANIESNNRRLEEQKRYGLAYATIHQATNSQIFQGTKSAFGNLAELQSSENSKLKAIGKTAALANIVIKTAEGALNIYAGFSSIPIVGPALGIAAAAAYTAYGVEQFNKVQAAADGGLVEGGIPGRDSVPFLLEPGELVVPKRNFADVVGAVDGKNNGGRDDEILAALSSIDSKLTDFKQYNFKGDVLADQTYIQILCDKIRDAVEFGNAKILPAGT